MNDPIKDAEHGITALRVFETIAKEVGKGLVRVTVHGGKVTSIVVEQHIDPKTLPNVGIIAELATLLGYGGLEFEIRGGRPTSYEALPKRKIEAA